jgi:hypothetical protein
MRPLSARLSIRSWAVTASAKGSTSTSVSASPAATAFSAASTAGRSSDLKPGDERRLRHPRPVLVQPLAEEDVDEPDRGVADFDRDLAGPRYRGRQVHQRQHFRISEPSHLNSLHQGLPSRAMTIPPFNAPNDALRRSLAASLG